MEHCGGQAAMILVDHYNLWWGVKQLIPLLKHTNEFYFVWKFHVWPMPTPGKYHTCQLIQPCRCSLLTRSHQCFARPTTPHTPLDIFVHSAPPMVEGGVAGADYPQPADSSDCSFLSLEDDADKLSECGNVSLLSLLLLLEKASSSCENHCKDHCLIIWEGHHQCPKDADNQVF